MVRGAMCTPLGCPLRFTTFVGAISIKSLIAVKSVFGFSTLGANLSGWRQRSIISFSHSLVTSSSLTDAAAAKISDDKPLSLLLISAISSFSQGLINLREVSLHCFGSLQYWRYTKTPGTLDCTFRLLSIVSLKITSGRSPPLFAIIYLMLAIVVVL